ncbi:2-oxo-4-hydroxy-4-carboxy-5-ureidoimidazoline decarboxylase [Pseudomonadota bacterium]
MQINGMNKEDFMAMFGDVYEHSPWIAAKVWESGLDAHHDSAEPLAFAFADVIHNASREQKLALLQAHPELAVAVASEHELSAASRIEQRGAGLDQCSPEEFAEFRHLNDAYQSRFGFPFIVAVKGMDRRGILTALKERLSYNKEQEFETATEQVIRIGSFRIEGKFEPHG